MIAGVISSGKRAFRLMAYDCEKQINPTALNLLQFHPLCRSP